MIVYASRERETEAAALLARALEALERAERGTRVEHEDAVELLVAFGDLEASVADALEPERDDPSAAARALRGTALSLGRLVDASWRDDPRGSAHWLRAAASELRALDPAAWPARVRARVPEGYAYYALRPECYTEAARRFAAELRPRRVVCIGLRTIGTSLSAAVAGALAGCGSAVHSLTLRPRGHPFDRRLELSASAERELREAVRDAFVAVVDEGPGLSGSSFAAVARALGGLGVPDERIVLFPSWEGDPSRFVSAQARERWGRHRRFCISFESTWLESGRLARAFSAPELRDLSAGRWRELLYGDTSQWPAAHAQHERRKYLAPAESDPASACGPAVSNLGSDADAAPARLLKFVGLADYGRSALGRARALANAGWAPVPSRLAHGFLATEFVRGRPLTVEDATPAFLSSAADYVACVARLGGPPEPVRVAEIEEMMRVNVGEALGPACALSLGALGRHRAAVEAGAAVSVDGRMLPHEWLALSGRWLKTDGVLHHDDHLFPGRQDIAWDVAGTVVEFGLGGARRRDFTASCAARLSDPRLGERLPFYEAAYLSFRIGYCTLAATSVEASDRERFLALRERYVYRLESALAPASDEPDEVSSETR